MRALVTGGGGFLGKAIVRRLLDRGDTVASLARSDQPELAAWGVTCHRGDVADRDALLRAAEGCDLVFHVAARVGAAGSLGAFERTNVLGTENALAACRAQGIDRLVYTSTPSVVHGGGDIEGADESIPYATHFESHYPKTKARAERLVLAANGPQLATVTLRPHLVWGPGDNHLIPRLLARARAGRVRFVGPKDKLVDATYIDNAADAHLLAGDRLAPGAACAGRAYFIGQGDPRPAGELVNGILHAAGLPPVTKRIPARLAWCIGASFELAFKLLRRDDEPLLTRFAARQLATAHWFDLGAARRDLGYAARVSTEEGLDRLRDHLGKDGGVGG